MAMGAVAAGAVDAAGVAVPVALVALAACPTAGLVTGVIVTPVTFPTIAAACFEPFVPRAARVALAFSVAATFSAGVIVGFFRGTNPKSANVDADCP